MKRLPKRVRQRCGVWRELEWKDLANGGVPLFFFATVDQVEDVVAEFEWATGEG